ncbi:MAG: sulfotransferase [Mariprofundaceae bacterium]
MAGLPRSGSTLLSAILRQNPRFHAAMTSPVGALFNTVLAELGAHGEFSPLCTEAQKQTIVRGLFNSYYHDVDKPVIFDTNRVWSTCLPALMQIHPESKMICCVRNVAWIMDSVEKLHRKNAFDVSKIFNNPSERGTVYSRLEALAQGDRMVGFAYQALREAFYGEHSNSLLLVDYELLTRHPANTMKLIYEFIDETPFAHDFSNVTYEAEAFDAHLGAKGLHKISGAVEFHPRTTILPPDLFARFSDMSFWLDQSDSRANVIAYKEKVKK